MLTAGLIDRAIDQWQEQYGRSTVKNTIAALVLVLDEAVRDGLLIRNPANDRARRRNVARAAALGAVTPENPRDYACPASRLWLSWWMVRWSADAIRSGATA